MAITKFAFYFSLRPPPSRLSRSTLTPSERAASIYPPRCARAGEAAGFSFQVSSHVLRHSCGYKLANDGRDTRSTQRSRQYSPRQQAL